MIVLVHGMAVDVQDVVHPSKKIAYGNSTIRFNCL